MFVCLNSERFTGTSEKSWNFAGNRMQLAKPVHDDTHSIQSSCFRMSYCCFACLYKWLHLLLSFVPFFTLFVLLASWSKFIDTRSTSAYTSANTHRPTIRKYFLFACNGNRFVIPIEYTIYVSWVSSCASTHSWHTHTQTHFSRIDNGDDVLVVIVWVGCRLSQRLHRVNCMKLHE